MSWKSVPRRSVRSSPLGRAQFTTAIARMLGKAVKLRHCPATVSATASWPFNRARAGNQPGSFRGSRKPHTNHWKQPTGFAFGKVAGEGASQETGPRVITRLRSEGDEGAIHAHFNIPAHTIRAGVAPPIRRHSSFVCCPCMPGCVDPWNGYRRHGCKSYRRHRGAD